MPRDNDKMWEYVTINDNKTNNCIFCQKDYSGGMSDTYLIGESNKYDYQNFNTQYNMANPT